MGRKDRVKIPKVTSKSKVLIKKPVKNGVIVYENAAIRYFNMRYNISAETKLRNNLKFDCTLSRRRDGFLCFAR